MAVVVVTNIFKPEKKDEEQWEDIIVEYLADKGRIKDFSRSYRPTLVLPSSEPI
jgi:hypothetical protein